MGGFVKRLAAFSAVVCLVVTGAFCALAEEEQNSDLTEQFQRATDAICALTQDSTQEEITAAFQLLNEIPTEEETQSEAALTGSIVDASNAKGNIQLLFAKLQQQQAELAKQQAQQAMDRIVAGQEELAETSRYMNDARVRLNEAGAKGSSKMVQDMRSFLQERGLFPSTLNPGKDSYTESEWETVNQLLEVYLDQQGSKTQTLMIYIQDYISQYNQYLSGADQQITQSQEALDKLARGQTMLGGSSVGMTVTCVLGGAVLGAVVTLLVLRKRKTV